MGTSAATLWWLCRDTWDCSTVTLSLLPRNLSQVQHSIPRKLFAEYLDTWQDYKTRRRVRWKKCFNWCFGSRIELDNSPCGRAVSLQSKNLNSIFVLLQNSHCKDESVDLLAYVFITYRFTINSWVQQNVDEKFFSFFIPKVHVVMSKAVESLAILFSSSSYRRSREFMNCSQSFSFFFVQTCAAVDPWNAQKRIHNSFDDDFRSAGKTFWWTSTRFRRSNNFHLSTASTYSDFESIWAYTLLSIADS